MLAFVAIALAVLGGGLIVVVNVNKGSHLELKGSILKIRSGVIDDNNSAAVLDLRVENVSDIPFVVRDVTVTFEDQDGKTLEGNVIAKSDFDSLLRFNRLLGSQLNDGLVIRDRIAPHATVDRMIAARFELPLAHFESGKALHLHIQDMDGPEWDTIYKLK